MNDAELVRLAARRVRNWAAATYDDKERARIASRAEELTALANRLETHALVPKEPTREMLDAGVGKMDSPFDEASGRRECKKIYRAMLTASEAK